YAAMQVQNGVSDVVLAGGAESMSNAPFYSVAMRWGVKAGPGVLLNDGLARGRVTAGGVNHPVPGGMIETAENLRRDYKISREEQDEYSVRSHHRAAAAADEGRFADEIVPVTISGRKGDTVVDRDEHIRPDSTVETLAKLRPIMGKQDPEATVTAGNASGQNDGAAICVVTSPEKAAELGLRPLARLVSWGVGGVPPKTMGIGPVPATARALELAGLKLSDMDLIELNEAFASQVLAVTREWGFTEADFARTNVNGSGISLGHPVGATGGRILATLTREMDRRQARYGLETMCIGGGQGLAAVFAVDVLDLKEDDARDTVATIEAAGGWALAVGADVGDSEQVQVAVDRIAAELGPPVVLVNNAGVTKDNLLFKMSDDDWD